ncbi:hypothetical protein DFS34DRAFT_616754 [Phlyctochytrium arcticum]|nr:hypothetical protein DFS34DRAFT_616754 [Phlyctochytrium arcticum]
MTPLVHLLLLNLSTYLLFAFDKSQSRSSSRRIPESVLLCLAFFGGGIGGYIAIRSLRHKSLNGRFVWVYRVRFLFFNVVWLMKMLIFLSVDWSCRDDLSDDQVVGD